jgi:hypothetical protein
MALPQRDQLNWTPLGRPLAPRFLVAYSDVIDARGRPFPLESLLQMIQTSKLKAQ